MSFSYLHTKNWNHYLLDLYLKDILNYVFYYIREEEKRNEKKIKKTSHIFCKRLNGTFRSRFQLKIEKKVEMRDEMRECKSVTNFTSLHLTSLSCFFSSSPALSYSLSRNQGIIWLKGMRIAWYVADRIELNRKANKYRRERDKLTI